MEIIRDIIGEILETFDRFDRVSIGEHIAKNKVLNYNYMDTILFCQLMIRPKIKQIEVARQLNVTAQTIYDLLRPSNDPRLSTLRKLARVYKISIDQLAANYDDPDKDLDLDVN